MANRLCGSAAALACVAFATLIASPVLAEEFPPVDPAELKLTSEPKAPGAAAIILYHEVDRDDSTGVERQYLRLKILTDEGRRYGDVEIPVAPEYTVGSIEARTVRPDGTIIPFAGKIYDKTIVKKGGLRYAIKAFTLPDVQVGSIVEYRYRRRTSGFYVYDSEWVLAGDLFTKRGKYSLRPNRDVAVAWSWPAGLPKGVGTPVRNRNVIELETRDVPAFIVEEHMPPESTVRQRVQFDYSNDDFDSDPDKYWKRVGKARYRDVENFLGSRRDLERAVAQIVSPQDDAQTKFRKIYERVQALRNTSFERSRTDAEESRDRVSRYAKAVDLLEQGRGDGDQITWLFLGLARAAGLPADAIAVSTRNNDFFNLNLMNQWKLSTNVVRVQLDGKEIYVDPGTKFAPPGLLPWGETMVSGLRLEPDGGTWVKTPVPSAADARVERRGTLHLDEDGTLAGTVTVKYTGLEALTRRLGLRLDDGPARRKSLETELSDDIRVGCDVRLINEPEWEASSRELVAEFDVRIPGWATQAGDRWLLGATPFGASDRTTFTASSRTHAIYFPYPYEEVDELNIALPSGVRPEGMFAPQSQSKGAVVYESRGEYADGALRLSRRLNLNVVIVGAQQYSLLREFFQGVRAGDEQQVVLVKAAARAAR